MATEPTEEGRAAGGPAAGPRVGVRRVLRVVGWGLLGLSGLLASAVAFLHTPPGTDLLRGLLVETLSERLNGSARLGDLSWSLGGDVVLSDLALDGEDAQPVVALREVRVTPRWGSLLGTPELAVGLLGLHVDLRRHADGSDSLSRLLRPVSDDNAGDGATRPLPPDFVLTSVSLSDARVTAETAAGARLTLDGVAMTVAVDARLRAEGNLAIEFRRFAAQLRLEAPRASGGGTVTLSTPLEASASLTARWDEGSCLRTGGCPASGPATAPWPASARLALSLAAPGIIEGAGREPFAFSLPDASATLDGGRLLLNLGPVALGPVALGPVSGQVSELASEAGGELMLELKGLAAKADGLSRLIAVAGGPADLVRADLEGDLRVAGPLATPAITGRLRWGEAALEASGSVSLARPARPEVKLRLSGRDLSPPRLLGLPGLPEVAAGFALELASEGLVPPDLKLRAGLDFEARTGASDETHKAKLAGSLEAEELTVEQVTVEAFGQSMRVSGRASRRSREFAADVGTRLDLAALARLLPLPASPPDAPVAPPRGELTGAFKLSGRLAPEGLAALEASPEAGANAVDAPRLGRSSFEQLTLTGQLDGSALGLGDRTLDTMRVELDLKLDGGAPRGEVRFVANGVRTGGGPALDAIRGRVSLDASGAASPLAGAWEASVTSGPIEAVLKGRFTLSPPSSASPAEPRLADGLPYASAEVTLEDVRMTGTPLSLSLGQAAVLRLTPSGVSLSDLDLAISSGGRRPRPLGRLAIGARADLERQEDRIRPGAVALDLAVEGLSLASLARALRHPLPPALARLGTLDLEATLEGRAEEPRARWSARLGLSPELRLELRGRLAERRLLADVAVGPRRGAPWLSGRVAIPITHDSGVPALDRHAPLEVEASLAEGDLARWVKALGLEASPGGALALALSVGGSLARPVGSLEAAVDGLSLHARPPLAGRLKLEVAPGAAGAVRLGGSLSLDGAEGRLGGAVMLAELGRLWTGAAPWWSGSVHGDLEPARLAALLAPEGVARLDPGSEASFDLRGSGQGRSLKTELGWLLAVPGLASGGGVALKALWPLTFKGLARLGDSGLELDSQLKGGAAQHSLATISLGASAQATPGPRGALALLDAVTRRALDAVRLEGRLELLERALSDLAPSLGLPGVTHGDVELAGTAARPAVSGSISWHGFRVLTGEPGRVALNLRPDGDALRLDLSAGRATETVAAAASNVGGGPPGLSLTASLPSLAELLRLGPEDDLPLRLAGLARALPLRELLPDVPALAALGEAVGGVLDLDLSLELALRAAVPRLTALEGRLALEGLSLPLPGSSRVLRDGRLALSFSPAAIRLERAEVSETDPGPGCAPCEVRALRLSGELGLGGEHGLTPTSLAARVEASDFLVGGRALDGPEAELDLDLAIAAPALASRPLAVTLTFSHLELDAPDRFVRAHYPQFNSYGDLLERPAGSPDSALPPLPRPPPLLPPLPPELDLAVALVFPKPARLAAFPLDVSLEGRLDLALSNGALTARGRLDVARGLLGAMGWELPFERGAITAEGPLDTGLLDLTFAVAPPPVALRDASLAGGHGGLARITARASLARGLETRFSGVGGPNVLDMATFLNSGRTRLWGAPDLPPSGTVRFGNADHGLVLTFINTNLRDFIFMDRTLGWSDSLVDHAAYGHLAWFDMQRTLPALASGAAGHGRLWLRGRPAATGLNRLELGWEWLLSSAPRGLFGFGPRLGLDGHLGAAFGWEWSSDD